MLKIYGYFSLSLAQFLIIEYMSILTVYGSSMMKSSFLKNITGLIFYALCSLSSAQIDQLVRDLEPVVVTGSQINAFISANNNDIFVYNYDAAADAWTQIPFQIDDVGADASYFSEVDGVLDNNDELVFMAKDGGDQAGPGVWITDADSRNYQRYEIRLTDSVNPALQAWAYIYRSSTLSYSAPVDYISANATLDQITSAAYELGHNANGVMDRLQISAAGGGNNMDIVDREKVRILGAIAFISYELNEDNVSTLNRGYKDGTVRVLREQTYHFAFGSSSYDKAVSERFYERLALTGGSLGSIGAEYGVNYIRQSLDLNSAASGMQFYSDLNNSLVIDGITDAPNTTLPNPGLTWNMVTGAPGTILQVVNLPAIGNPQVLYYYDNSSGGSNDGTADTGDMASWGDIGVSFTHPNIGTFAVGYSRFFLGANQSPSFVQQLAQYVNQPIGLTVTNQAAAGDGLLSARISNARVESNMFRWDVEINRSNDWGAGLEAILGEVALFFNVNPMGVATANPSVSDLIAALNNGNYVISTGRAGSHAQAWARITYNSAGGGSDWYPPLNSWVRVFTLSLPILDPLQHSQLSWRPALTFAQTGNGTQLQLTLTGAGDILLPVELTEFGATVEQGRIRLYWTTESETDNMGFILYRSERADGDFVRINDRLIPGSGNSQSFHRYEYLDQKTEAAKNYYYRLADVDYSGKMTVHSVIAALQQQPQEFALQQNYPNPFNPSTNIRFSLREAGEVTLVVYNLRGEKIRTLLQGWRGQGSHETNWDGRDELGRMAASGTYIYELKTNERQVHRRMVLIK